MKLKRPQKIHKNREEFQRGGGRIFLAGQNIYPCTGQSRILFAVGNSNSLVHTATSPKNLRPYWLNSKSIGSGVGCNRFPLDTQCCHCSFLVTIIHREGHVFFFIFRPTQPSLTMHCTPQFKLYHLRPSLLLYSEHLKGHLTFNTIVVEISFIVNMGKKKLLGRKLRIE